MKTAKEQLNEFLSLKENWFDYEDDPLGKPFIKEELDWFLNSVWKPLVHEIPKCRDVYIYPTLENGISVEWANFFNFEVSLEVSLSKKTAILHVCGSGESSNQSENEISIYIEDLNLTNIDVLNSVIQVLKFVRMISSKEKDCQNRRD